VSRPPQFSVVLPTHNRPALLAEAVASVLAQSVSDFELLVVDDGSEPPAVVAADDRIRLLRFEENRGPAAARNAGIDAARGTYLAFLDDDDLFTPDRLAVALEGLRTAPIAVCWSRFHDRPPGRNRRLTGDVADSILDGPTPNLGATAIGRDLAPRFDERWYAVEDVDWWLRVAEVGEVATVPGVFHLIRRHEGPRHRNDLAARLEENVAFVVARDDWFARHRRAAAYRWKRVGLMARAMGDRRRARQAFARALRLSPRPSTLRHLVRSVVGPSAAPARAGGEPRTVAATRARS
jgi:glycosyltransferase involved in cell wall biosynthesis